MALPVVAANSPAVGTSLAASGAVIIDATDADNDPSAITIMLEPAAGAFEVIYDGDSFGPSFRMGATAVANIANGKRFTIARSGGWPAGDIIVKVLAASANGATKATLGWTVPEAVTPVLPAPTVSTKTAAGLDPLGFGVSRPFKRSVGQDFETAFGVPLVNSDVGQILGTSPGELRWRPSFGTPLSRLRHQNNSPALAEITRVHVERALARWEPRIRVLGIDADPVAKGSENRIELHLSYQVGTARPQGVTVAI